LTAAKLLADAYLDVPWLMHLDVYRSRVAAMLSGRSRPDLIGQDAVGDWVVLESKGRTGSFDTAALNQAKIQAGQITTIGGAVPRIFVAVQAHFQGGRLSVDWHDPPSDADSRINVEVSEADLLEAYYRPIERMLDERADLVERITINDEVFDTVRVPDADLQIGLQADIRRRAVRRAEPRRRSTRPDERTTEGSDGVLVRLGESWDAINMRLEPQARSRLFVG
jgi:hypothetical protein